MKSSTVITLILFISIIACKSMPSADNSINGWWQQEAYGNIYFVEGETIYLYNTSDIGCYLVGEYPSEFMGKNYELRNDSLFLVDGINKYRFKRLEAEDVNCIQQENDDPLHNFDVLWQTFDEHYSYFQERKIDWNRLRDKYRSQLSEESTDVELYLVLNKMLEEIGDGHVGVSATDEVEEAAEAIEVREEDESEDGPGFISFLGLAKEIAISHVDTLHEYNRGIVRWGTVADNILYLQINAMFLVGDPDLPTTLEDIPFFQAYIAMGEERPNQNQEEVKGISKKMKKILGGRKYDACILDIRFNGGGKDEVALEIMSHFTSTPYDIGQKKAFFKGNWMQPVKIVQHKAETDFVGPLAVLTSHLSASASEIMMMSVIANPENITIGSTTEGIFSDMLDKVLPNGWDYSLSNEVYLDHQGENHEAIGIRPGYSLNYPRDDAQFFEGLSKGYLNGDAAILQAIELLAQQDEAAIN